jgi:hypothetical protein
MKYRNPPRSQFSQALAVSPAAAARFAFLALVYKTSEWRPDEQVARWEARLDYAGAVLSHARTMLRTSVRSVACFVIRALFTTAQVALGQTLELPSRRTTPLPPPPPAELDALQEARLDYDGLALSADVCERCHQSGWDCVCVWALSPECIKLTTPKQDQCGSAAQAAREQDEIPVSASRPRKPRAVKQNASAKSSKPRKPSVDRSAQFQAATEAMAQGATVRAAARQAGLPESSLRAHLRKTAV